MDAVKFIKERNRMCKTNVSCYGCPAHDIGSSNSCKFAMENWFSPEQQINLVKEWSAAHPRKTRQSAFLEQWPEAKISDTGILDICPIAISVTHRGKHGGCGMPGLLCNECCREFWMQEVE